MARCHVGDGQLTPALCCHSAAKHQSTRIFHFLLNCSRAMHIHSVETLSLGTAPEVGWSGQGRRLFQREWQPEPLRWAQAAWQQLWVQGKVCTEQTAREHTGKSVTNLRLQGGSHAGNLKCLGGPQKGGVLPWHRRICPLW